MIKAWDMAVATMTRGEVCVVQCIGKYGYGKRGSKPKIPPDATLVFEIELIDWRGIVESLLLASATLKIIPLAPDFGFIACLSCGLLERKG